MATAHFWDWQKHDVTQSIDLGEKGLIPLEVRFHHNPDSAHGFVGAALSSTMWHWYKADGEWKADKVIEVDRRRSRGLADSRAGADHRPRPLAGRPLALLLQLAARRHAPVRRQRPGQSAAHGPALAGGRAGQGRATFRAASCTAARRCCSSAWTASGSTSPTRSSARWDNQFYPEMARAGLIDCCRSTAIPTRRHDAQRALLRRLRQGARRPGPCPRDALSRRRLDLRHLDLVAFGPSLAGCSPRVAACLPRRSKYALLR